MNFKEFISSFKVGDSSWEGYPALFERINIAKKIIKSQNVTKRSIKAPHYLTDFGLRKSESPSLFIKHHCNRLNKELPNKEEVLKELMAVEIEAITDWFDAIVLILGDYDICYLVLNNRLSEFKKINSVKDLIKLGTLCGIMKNADLSLEFFKKASIVSKDKTTKNVLMHRIDTAILKRKKDEKSFFKYTSNMIDKLLISKDTDEIISLLDNLSAFQIIMQKNNNHIDNLTFSRLLLLNGKMILKSAINAKEKIDIHLTELVRYYSQISINQVQLELELKNFKIAENIIKEDIDLVEKYNGEYLSEALSTLAYVYYKENLYKEAVNTSILALKEHADIGNLIGVKETKKLLIACFYKMNEIEKAEKVFLTIEIDPLGVSSIYEQYRIIS